MPLYKKLFLGGLAFTIIPAFLHFLDGKLLDCTEKTTLIPGLLGFVDIALGYTTFFIPVGIVVLLISFFLYIRSRGNTLFQAVFKLVLVLIVMALIGSVILASLNCARCVTPNYRIFSKISSLRAEAELYRDNHNQTYTGFCSTQALEEAQKSVRDLKPDQGSLCFVPQNSVQCFDGADTYAVSARQIDRVNDKKYWCADSTGFTGVVNNEITGTSCK